MEKFVLSSISDVNIEYEKISRTVNLENLLNKNCAIENYSLNVKSVFFIFIVTEPKNSICRKDKITFLTKNKILKISFNLNYNEFLTIEEHNSIKILAFAFLKAIQTFLLNRKDFNGEKFYQDVKNLFIQENLIPKNDENTLN